MLQKYELLGIFASAGLMALALFLLRVDNTMEEAPLEAQPASAIQVVSDETGGLEGALGQAFAERDNLTQLVVDDVRLGSGSKVETGDQVTVHYVGRLANGQEFDSSYNRDEPFTFTVGAGEVITGWEEGIVGMKVGGERVLVVPPAMAYGARGMGPIPPNATLLFLVELVAIN